MIKCFLVKVALRKDAFRWKGGGCEGGAGSGGRERGTAANKPKQQVDTLPSLLAACSCWQEPVWNDYILE